MDEIEAKETALRILIRDEVLRMLEDDTLGGEIREVMVAMLRQLGFEEILKGRGPDGRAN